VRCARGRRSTASSAPARRSPCSTTSKADGAPPGSSGGSGAVAHDGVEPRLHVDGDLAADDRAVRAHETVLDGVLGQSDVAPAARGRVPDQARAVARDERREGRLVAAGGGEQEGMVGALSHR
jgi:hypothetical protein